MKITRFKTDDLKERKGTWVECPEGLRIKIARLNNRAYIETRDQLFKPHRRIAGRLPLSEDVVDDCVAKALSLHVLLDWEGLEDEAGNAIQYSHDKAYEYLRGYREFKDLVVEAAVDIENFRMEEENANLGNLSPLSAGSSNGAATKSNSSDSSAKVTA